MPLLWLPKFTSFYQQVRAKDPRYTLVPQTLEISTKKCGQYEVQQEEDGGAAQDRAGRR